MITNFYLIIFDTSRKLACAIRRVARSGADKCKKRVPRCFRWHGFKSQNAKCFKKIMDDIKMEKVRGNQCMEDISWLFLCHFANC